MTDSARSATDAWVGARIRLKHNWFDWLVQSLDGTPAEPPDLFREWDQKWPQLETWLKQAAGALDPAQVLAGSAFGAWPGEFRKRWAKELSRRFLRSSGAADLAGLAVKLLAKANQLIARWLASPAVLNGDERKNLRELLRHARKLIEQLPREVGWPAAHEPPPEVRDACAEARQLLTPHAPAKAPGAADAAPAHRAAPAPDDLPLILMIDDLFGRAELLRGRADPGPEVRAATALSLLLRKIFCARFRLFDETAPECSTPHRAVARIRFCPAQRVEALPDGRTRVKNDAAAVDPFLAAGGTTDGRPVALVLLDLQFNHGVLGADGTGPQNDGAHGLARVLPWVRRRAPTVPVVAMTSAGRDEVVRAVRETVPYLHKFESGARDVLRQLFDGRRATPAQLRAALGLNPDWVAEDRATLDAFLQGYEAANAPDQSNVLILGPSGAGKELLAEYIHRQSPRADKPLVVTNCGTYTEPERAQIQLFGVYAGAYTGIVGESEGKFQDAHESTLFLDEIGDVPEPTQAVLLRVLNYPPGARTIEPYGLPHRGSNLKTEVSVRVIAATDQDTDKFREAFAGRFNAVIRIPGLNERPLDIGPLARTLLRVKLGAPRIELDPGAVDALRAHRFTANARELGRILAQATRGLGERNLLMRENVESVCRDFRRAPAERPRPAPAPDAPAAAAPAPGGELARAVAAILRAATEGFDRLTVEQAQELTDALRGRIVEVVAALAEWTLRSTGTAPEFAEYLCGRQMGSTAAQQLIKRLLSLDRPVLDRLATSPHKLRIEPLERLLAEVQNDPRRQKR